MGVEPGGGGEELGFGIEGDPDLGVAGVYAAKGLADEVGDGECVGGVAFLESGDVEGDGIHGRLRLCFIAHRLRRCAQILIWLCFVLPRRTRRGTKLF